MESNLAAVPNIEVLRPWVDLRFDASSGPGGQNVNKVATRATLSFDLAGCTIFTPAPAERLRDRLGRRLTRDGRLLIVRQAGRTQLANRTSAEEELVRLLSEALRPKTPRHPTRPTRAARERRLQSKRQTGERKRLRGRPGIG